jgi:hypothetical protein
MTVGFVHSGMPFKPAQGDQFELFGRQYHRTPLQHSYLPNCLVSQHYPYLTMQLAPMRVWQGYGHELSV